MSLLRRGTWLIELGSQLFRKHTISSPRPTRARRCSSEKKIWWARTWSTSWRCMPDKEAMLLAAFDQHLPEGQKPLLPMSSH